MTAKMIIDKCVKLIPAIEYVLSQILSPEYAPLDLHNLSGYDAHFIICVMATQFQDRVKVLAFNKEKYISFTKYGQEIQAKFRFIDSFRFMSSSLEKLASYLTEYKLFNAMFAGVERKTIELLTRKGVLPYEYLDERGRLSETLLPPKDKFYSTLNDSKIWDKDYAHAQQAWCAFNIKTLGEYVSLYMKTGILLLTDILESSREQCLEACDLDPAHYYMTPGLTWDAMLKYLKVRLELLTDVDMLLMNQQGKRGGVSECPNRYATGNNNYIPGFNKDGEIIFIGYLDANNLYGWAIEQPLPYILEWVKNFENLISTFQMIHTLVTFCK